MPENIKSTILKFMGKNRERDYTIPDIQKGIGVKNREHVVIALTQLNSEGKLAIWTKGRTKYYRLG